MLNKLLVSCIWYLVSGLKTSVASVSLWFNLFSCRHGLLSDQSLPKKKSALICVNLRAILLGVLCFSAVNLPAQSNLPFLINNGKLTTPLNGNAKTITNLVDLIGTNGTTLLGGSQVTLGTLPIVVTTSGTTNTVSWSNSPGYVTASITNGLGSGAAGTPISGVYNIGIVTNSGVITYNAGTTNSNTGTNGAAQIILHLRITNTTALNITNARPGQVFSVVIESGGTATNFTQLALTNSNYKMIGGLTNVVNVTTGQVWLAQWIYGPSTNAYISTGIDYR